MQGYLFIRDYTYDGYGNRTDLTEYTLKEHTDGAAGESALPIRTEYRYNPLNQLTEMGEKKYSYTLNGGLRAETQNGQEKYSCRYDSLGRLTHIFHEGELIQKNEYDGLGNRAGSLFPKEQEGESNVRCCIDHTDTGCHRRPVKAWKDQGR
ncbi:MAG: hypothetical protein Q4D94_14680 [Bacillota bacterium]|nr:hypothetical protein [Bacillota bacterium]